MGSNCNACNEQTINSGENFLDGGECSRVPPQYQRLPDQHNDHGLLANGDGGAGSACGSVGGGGGGGGDDSCTSSP